MGTASNVKKKKKKKKGQARIGALSFGDLDEDGEADNSTISSKSSFAGSKHKRATDDNSTPATDSEQSSDAATHAVSKRLKPNSSLALQPKALTKSALLREAQMKEQLRKQFLQIQEAVKQTEFMLPFVFFNGKNSPGGRCRMKKGDFVWLFLERARKVGADMANNGDVTKRDWARIGVDDLMLVKRDIIIPHVSHKQ